MGYIDVDDDQLCTGAEFRFGSKAQTLQSVARGTMYRVLPMVRITRREWVAAPDSLVATVANELSVAPLIVRSSAANEDSADESHAGAYESVLNVAIDQLRESVDRVFESFGSTSDHDEVLVQPMAQGVVRSGVAMTCDPSTGAPYTVVNYSIGSDTTSVTAGRDVASWWTANDADLDTGAGADRGARRLIDALRELVAITRHPHLDVEFAITVSDEVIVFQVRRITTVDASTRAVSRRGARLRRALDAAARQYEAAQAHARHLHLAPSLLGVMPDWNPAELIGLKPRPLAYSLYDTIITSRAWAVGRVRLGYRDLRTLPLMHQVGGTPFILVSASLMSFVPGGVPEHVARQVVTVAQRLLRESPEAHDKVEFAIMPTCYKSGLNDQEWRDRYAEIDEADWAVYVGHLRDLTNSLIGDESFLTSAVDRTASLHALVDELRQRVAESSTAIDGLSLLRAAEAHGTELFSEVARSAFIATDILADLERSGAVPPGLLDDTVAAASTVGAELVTDHAKLPLSEFLNKHGHVRPGTYDVTVARYDETPAEYFAGGPLPQRPGSPQSASAPRPASDELDALLREIGYEFSWEQLIEFATTAISLREEVKHAFTKLLSDAMEIFVRHCAHHGIDRELVSFLSVSDFERSLRSRRTTNQLTKTAIRNRKRWRRENDVRLPDLLTDVLDIRFGQENLSQPTFVTRLRAEGPVTDATSGTLSGAVVFLECADPGHDWIFTHGIAGFVTQFGGENSHMAIRARELQVPAVIGAGSRYERWSRSDRIVIDGRSKTVEVLG